MSRLQLLWLVFAVVMAVATNAEAATPPSTESALALFERRILPILNSPKPSSCSECHLSGVDLKDYIRPTQTETFTALVRAGLADTEKPHRSKLLTFIARKPEKSSLITDKVRQQEYDAFRAWLTAAARDPQLMEAKTGGEPIGPELPGEVIRHARSDRILASFVDNIWSEIGRCAACHSPDKNAKQVKEHGEQVSWITLGDPESTLQYMLDADLIDPIRPEKSLLLTKPTLQVEHGGGQKMVVGDRSYKQFRRFLDDYAATTAGKYQRVSDLPQPSAEVSHVSEIWFKLIDVPEEFDQKLLQVDLYRWDGQGWSETRWATSDRPVFGKGRLWQHSLSLTASRGTQRARQLRERQTLPPGRYLVKVYVDTTDKLQKDHGAELGESELVGELEVESRWPEGYGAMTTASFPTR